MARNTKTNDLVGLSLLGSGKTVKPIRKLETFPNHSKRDYTVTLSTEEFTCVCPMTGQPDFAKIKIQYIPDKKIVESKSLKLYFGLSATRAYFTNTSPISSSTTWWPPFSHAGARSRQNSPCAAALPYMWKRNIKSSKKSLHKNT